MNLLNQPIYNDDRGKRKFHFFPAAVLGFIVDHQKRLLLLSHKDRNGMWEVISGALEKDEYILDGVLREVREEVGSSVAIKPLGTIHAFTFHYDRNVKYMISLCYLLAYEGGKINPGSDMEGSSYRWWTIEEINDPRMKLLVPRNQKWLANRAIQLYSLWLNEDVRLEPRHSVDFPNKYEY